MENNIYADTLLDKLLKNKPNNSKKEEKIFKWRLQYSINPAFTVRYLNELNRYKVHSDSIKVDRNNIYYYWYETITLNEN